jgi:hypothetical protein
MSTCYNVENYLNTTVETPLSRSFPIISSSHVYKEKEKNNTTVCCRARYSPSSLWQQPAIESGTSLSNQKLLRGPRGGPP